jgi:hypothetical protein
MTPPSTERSSLRGNPQLPPTEGYRWSGWHRVRVAGLGYRTVIVDGVFVQSPDTVSVDVTLAVQALARDSIVVREVDRVLDPLATADVESISGTEIRRLPVKHDRGGHCVVVRRHHHPSTTGQPTSASRGADHAGPSVHDVFMVSRCFRTTRERLTNALPWFNSDRTLFPRIKNARGHPSSRHSLATGAVMC